MILVKSGPHTLPFFQCFRYIECLCYFLEGLISYIFFYLLFDLLALTGIRWCQRDSNFRIQSKSGINWDCSYLLKMGNIEGRFEQQRTCCHLQGLVLDRYTLGKNILFKQLRNVFSQKNSLNTSHFLLLMKNWG